MVLQCKISFDNNNSNGVFFTGQNITGKVEISLDKPKQVNGILLKIFGRSIVRWTEKKSSRKSRVIYHGREEYISSNTHLVSRTINYENSTNIITLQPGIHTYNFACALPHKLPSSFEGTWGYIRYTAKVVMDRPWKFNHTQTVGFTVLKVFDLNYETPILRIPAEVEICKEFWCGPCRTKPLTMSASTPQTGYVPGQIIPVKACINNGSRLNIEYVIFSLQKIITYHSEHPRKKQRNEIITTLEVRSEPIPKHTKKDLYKELRVPAVPPTCMALCKIIQISYELGIKAKIRGLHLSPTITMPITIGNIPLVHVIQQQSTTSNSEPIFNSLQSSEFSKFSLAADLSPPSYEESLQGKRINITEDELHPINSNVEFIPRYPVYNFDGRRGIDYNKQQQQKSQPYNRETFLPPYEPQMPSAPNINL